MEEKWNAIINCDKRFDGLFYYGVKTTGIFCRPSCRAKPPLKKNTLFFKNIDEAVDLGFRPCKMCRPDINEHIYEPNKILVQKVRETINCNYKNKIDFKAIFKDFGMSNSNLTRLFRHYYGLTPNEYLVKVRIDKSKELLTQTTLDILDVAYEVGFKSLSNFYMCFKKLVGYTPKEYRLNTKINQGEIKMKRVFAPGCALMIYKPELGRKMLKYLNEDLEKIDEHLICCRHNPNLEAGTQVINTCSGCNKRYSELYDSISTISLWEVLANDETFPFPDYQGKEMTILDACPTRHEDKIHDAVRVLLKKMNINVVEPEKTRTKGTCCGDSFYGVLPVEQVKEEMKKRANEMPVEDVVVYCVSCCKSMHIGGKKPRYMVDLLLGEETVPGVFEPDQWHAELDKFIKEH